MPANVQSRYAKGFERLQALSLPGWLLCPLPLLSYGHPCIRWKYRQRKATYDLRFQTDQPPMPRRQQGSFAGILLAHTMPSYAYSLAFAGIESRSEEHTSELQSLRHLVCRLLLEKKKKNKY